MSREATIGVEGTLTKSVAGGTGYVNVQPHADDNEFEALYGLLTAGAVKVGADDASVYISEIPAGIGHVLMLLGAVSLAATQGCRFPMLGNAPGVTCIHDKPSKESMLVTGTDMLVGSLGTMAVGEDFHFIVRLRSKTAKAPTITVTGGTWV